MCTAGLFLAYRFRMLPDDVTQVKRWAGWISLLRCVFAFGTPMQLSLWNKWGSMGLFFFFFLVCQSERVLSACTLLKRISALLTSLWFNVAQGLEVHLEPSCVRSLPFSLPGHAQQDANPDTNLPAIWNILLSPAGSVRFNYEAGSVFVHCPITSLMCFSEMPF